MVSVIQINANDWYKLPIIRTVSDVEIETFKQMENKKYKIYRSPLLTVVVIDYKNMNKMNEIATSILKHITIGNLRPIFYGDFIFFGYNFSSVPKRLVEISNRISFRFRNRIICDSLLK